MGKFYAFGKIEYYNKYNKQMNYLMNQFPTKEQINKMASESKKYQDKTDKADCEYMWSLMCETFDQAYKSDPAKFYSHTEIDKDKINNWFNIRMTNCKFGVANEPVENILEPLGVKLIVNNYSTTKPFMSYNKLDKTFYIHPR